jgi:hypothetical protein
VSEQLALIDLPRMPSEWDEREVYYSQPEHVWPLVEYLRRVAPACLDGVIVEPCVGGGALVDGLERYHPGTDARVVTGDVRDVGADWIGDWTAPVTSWRFARSPEHVQGQIYCASLIVSNPPFTQVIEIIEASWRRCPGAVVAMLLPARWYEPTKKRGPWLRRHNPDRINIGRCEFVRPDGSSAGDGDSTTYEWNVWLSLEANGGNGPLGGHHEIIPWKESPKS